MAKTKAKTTTLDRALRGTFAGLWAERLVRAFWPLLTVALLIWAALAFGVQDVLPGGWAAGFGLGGLAVALASAAWGVWRLDIPRRAEAARRLDQTLPGRPLTAMADTVVVGAGDPGTQALWAAHLARVSRGLDQARAVPGDLRLALFD
ncbi:MAG: DUF4175 family protein, partial [Alphaproteobacteria bacterium]|nr:DUF4175 family protein [Alphaproteobacteria bacterium]